MVGFGKKARTKDTAKTFVEALGGRWFGTSENVSTDGGAYADFVGYTLERARTYSIENNIPPGQKFEFCITDIPKGIMSPYEIVSGLMIRANDYDLIPGSIVNQKATFTRKR